MRFQMQLSTGMAVPLTPVITYPPGWRAMLSQMYGDKEILESENIPAPGDT